MSDARSGDDREAQAGALEALEAGGAEGDRRRQAAAALRGHPGLGEHQPGLAEHLRRRQVAGMAVGVEPGADVVAARGAGVDLDLPAPCLLYTSDAADDLLCV